MIITAVHRDESFLSQGTERLIRELESNDQDVVVRNLYDLKFDPVLTTDDFLALKAGSLPADIAREQEYIDASDYIWVVFPIWWTSMPAILKGYIDRVFLSGFAYRMEGDYPKGLLTGKQVIILNSMGMSEDDYDRNGMFKALELTIDKGIFEFSGMDVVAHKYFSSIMSASTEKREAYYDEILNLVNLIVSGRNNNGFQKQKNVA
jgi:NAD(P)H dehydrogenase (quinone)